MKRNRVDSSADRGTKKPLIWRWQVVSTGDGTSSALDAAPRRLCLPCCRRPSRARRRPLRPRRRFPGRVRPPRPHSPRRRTSPRPLAVRKGRAVVARSLAYAQAAPSLPQVARVRSGRAGLRPGRAIAAQAARIHASRAVVQPGLARSAACIVRPGLYDDDNKDNLHGEEEHELLPMGPNALTTREASLSRPVSRLLASLMSSGLPSRYSHVLCF